MFRGFNLKNIELKADNDFYYIGKKEYDKIKKEIGNTLDSYITPDGSLDGSKLQENWFPQINCDVFISHSHKNQEEAITLSGMLSGLGLSCFVDSCIWGYSNDLLKLIDNKHCYNSETNTYDYHLRNFTTSHVHMMLSNALFRMIDNSECVFFLNTPDSIKIDAVTSKTISPWIYSELSITQVIRKKKPNRKLIKGESRELADKNINDRISIEYDINLSHLVNLELQDIRTWINNIENSKSEHVLDVLYKTFPLPFQNTRLHS